MSLYYLKAKAMALIYKLLQEFEDKAIFSNNK